MKNIFYETGHGAGADHFTVESGRDFSFPYHLHRGFEIIYVLEGTLDVSVEDETYTIEKNGMIMICPHGVHGLTTKEHSRHVLCIFSPELIGGVAETLIRMPPSPPVVYDATGIYGTMLQKASELDSVCRIKGLLYYVCDPFLKLCRPAKPKRSGGDSELLHAILTHIEDNYAGDCSLEKLSLTLNYSYSYLSRVFSENVGVTFSSYVTQLRISKACSLLQAGEHGIMETAYKCGFPSVRSFNRNFAKYTGKTPTEYKKAAAPGSGG